MKIITLLSLVLALCTLPAVAESPVEKVGSPQYVALSVEDVDRSIDWYVATLGLSKLDDTTDDGGRWRIANLTGKGLWIEIIWDKRDSPAERARGIAKFGFGVPDVHAVADRIEASGAERPRVVSFKKHNVDILQLKDPDGNIVQLTSKIP